MSKDNDFAPEWLAFFWTTLLMEDPIAGGMIAGGLAVVRRTPGLFIRKWQEMRQRREARKRERAHRNEIDAQRRHELEMARIKNLPPPPPIPIDAQIAAAEQRLDDRLQIIETLPMGDPEKKRMTESAVRKFEEEVEQILYQTH